MVDKRLDANDNTNNDTGGLVGKSDKWTSMQRFRDKALIDLQVNPCMHARTLVHWPEEGFIAQTVIHSNENTGWIDATNEKGIPASDQELVEKHPIKN